jgi:tol-pal system protein YbgF
MAISSLKRGVGALILIGAFAAGPGLAQTQWGGSSTPEELRYRLDILDAELADIRARLGGATGSSGATVSGTGNPQLEGEIRRLTAQLEELQNRVDRIAADLTNRLGDIEFRLTELEGGEPTGEVAPIGGGTVSGGTLSPFPNQGTTGGTTGGQETALVSVSEQSDLDRAINDVNEGRFDQAEDNLRQFVSRYPDSALKGEAWYWMGESQFARGIHADAARSYLNGYQSNTRGTRAPHNLFRLGVSLGRLGVLDEACKTLRQVRIQFPSAGDIVSQADAEADTLTCG